jgi:hypothetical protein
VKDHLRTEAERAAFAEVEKRLICEGLLDAGKHKDGFYDSPMRNAALDFQQKNAVFAQADLTRGTLEAMARPILQNDFLALRRVLAERAAHAGRIIEDGSAIEAMPPAKRNKPRKQPTYKNKAGEDVPVPDLVGQATDATMARLGLATPEDALAFFRRHAESDFRSTARGRALSRLARVLRSAHGSGGRDRPRRRVVRLSLQRQGRAHAPAPRPLSVVHDCS